MLLFPGSVATEPSTSTSVELSRPIDLLRNALKPTASGPVCQISKVQSRNQLSGEVCKYIVDCFQKHSCKGDNLLF